MKVYCHTTAMIIDVIMKAKNEEVNYTDKNKIYIKKQHIVFKGTFSTLNVNYDRNYNIYY